MVTSPTSKTSRRRSIRRKRPYWYNWTSPYSDFLLEESFITSTTTLHQQPRSRVRSCSKMRPTQIESHFQGKLHHANTHSSCPSLFYDPTLDSCAPGYVESVLEQCQAQRSRTSPSRQPCSELAIRQVLLLDHGQTSQASISHQR